MIAIIATAIACFIVGGVLSYILFRYVLKSKYDNVLKEAETEAEVIKKKKLLERERHQHRFHRAVLRHRCEPAHHSGQGCMELHHLRLHLLCRSSAYVAAEAAP